jgi:RNA polymerase sigma-70 factor (ECF subfamily)
LPSEIHELVGRCLNGDAAAIRQFVDQYQQVVYARCLRMLGNRHDAEDATQETLLRIVRSLHHWDQQRPILPWILTVAVNRCRTALSRRRDRPVAGADLGELVQQQRGDNPDLGEELESALAALCDDYQAVFRMFYQQEWSCVDIGLCLGVPEGTVKTWLYRARREVADRLRRRGVVSDDGHELHRL